MPGFTVTGEFIVRMARDLVLDGRWERALEFLDETIHCGMGIAVEIASGRTTLTGENAEIFSADEDPAVKASYETDVRNLYRGVYEAVLAGGRSWIRPVAYVTSFGEGDLSGTPRWRRQDGATAKDGILFDFRPSVYGSRKTLDRAAFYCEHQGEWSMRSCLIPSYKGGMISVPVICEMTPPPPVWLPRIKGLTEAVADFENRGGRLEERGWRILCDEGAVIPSPSPFKKSSLVPSQQDFAERMAKEERVQAEARRIYVSRCSRFRVEILRRLACSTEPKWYVFSENVGGPEVEVRVPYTAFMHWALQDDENQPPYSSVSDSGMRMPEDQPSHTDWMLGATLFPYNDKTQWEPWDHFDELYNMGYRERSRVWQRTYDTAVTILSRGNAALLTGRVVHPKKNTSVDPSCIAVIPYASPDYVQAAHSALAVISEVGGSFAHLVVVSEGATIIQVDNALKKYPEGSTVRIDLLEKSADVVEIEDV